MLLRLTGSRSRFALFLIHNSYISSSPVQHARSIEKVVALLIPGILPSTLVLPPLPTSATSNPNVPLSIPLPPESNTPIPFIATTYSHACPTRAPGDQTRMYSVLSESFQCQVTGEEKAKRQAMRASMCAICIILATTLTISSCSTTCLRQHAFVVYSIIEGDDRKRLPQSKISSARRAFRLIS